MTYTPRMRPGTRATRVSLQGRISLTIQLENGRQLPAKLHQLSITGGLLEVVTYLEERSHVSLTLPLGAGVVRPQAEMLFPMWSAHGYQQPFRFTHLWAEERQTLEMEITELLKQTVTRSTAGLGADARPRRFDLESL